MTTIEFNKDNKLYIIDVDKDGLSDINIFKVNSDKHLFTELGINQDRLNEILRTY